jgi:Uncharacterised nucleotidyltransferase/Transglutaminase-like superfamily
MGILMRSSQEHECSEFELVLACLRWPQQYVDGERVRQLAGEDLRWLYLLQIANYHKVSPLVFRNLETFAGSCVPSETMAILAAQYEHNVAMSERAAHHLRLVSGRLQDQGIGVRVFKGIPLAVAAFQDFRLRDAGDIDLLVEEKDLFPAERSLEELGYVRLEPQARLTPRRLRSYLAHQKDFAYEHSREDLALDLHWRLFRNPFLPSNAGLTELGEAQIMLGGEAIATLPAPRLLLYLCVHGALDGWLRLKWLADVSALLRNMTPADLREGVRLAREQRALPYFSAACILSHDLLGNEVPAGCLDRSDRQVARIVRFSMRAMSSNDYRPAREEIPSQAWFLNEFQLFDSFRYRMNLVARSLFRPRLWRTFDLPELLFPLYALLSPIEWILFHVRRRVRKLMTPADIGLALEAGLMLTFFRIALNFLPVQKLTAWMSRGNTERVWLPQERANVATHRIEWSIETVVRHAPVTFVCFPQCLAAYFMLRRRHVASRLFYGVAREANQLKAHTWVKVGDRTIVGGDVESHFTVLASFP